MTHQQTSLQAAFNVKGQAALLAGWLLAAFFLIVSMTDLTLAQSAEGPVAQTGTVKPSQSVAGQEELDWREPLLAEMARLATTLEQEQKFNQLLRDRLDILDHRIDQLEEQNSALTDQVGALEESSRPDAAAQSRPSAAPTIPSERGTPAMPAHPKLGQENQSPANAPKDFAQKPSPNTAPNTAPNQAPAEPRDKREDKSLPDNFEQFLDMGEAMMRRFFGVVKEFRKEFDDNRA